ncbi:hypothetical protein GCM10010360_25300 [Streptomyces nogalater]
MRLPPGPTCTVCRSVALSSTRSPCVNGAGGMLPGSVSWGMDAHVSVHCPLPAAMAADRAGAAVPLRGPSVPDGG